MVSEGLPVQDFKALILQIKSLLHWLMNIDSSLLELWSFISRLVATSKKSGPSNSVQEDTGHVIKESSVATKGSPVVEIIHMTKDNVLLRRFPSTVSNMDDIQIIDGRNQAYTSSGGQEFPLICSAPFVQESL
ncbi:hypothetical protein VNO77_19127 [Canavalia gladiata]|uniref:Uncharacterized protein n=1 Tax=Canavalia gladiata TaxID=3824 RepID=A0AAN9LLW1_CANGL